MPNEKNNLKQLVAALEDIHAKDILAINVQDQTSVTDYMVICTGRSSRHVRSIAEHIAEKMKAINMPPLSKNGLDSGEWALIDFGYFIVHIMQADTRLFYNIEGLWQ